MQLYYCNEIIGTTAYLNEEESHHLLHVMRTPDHALVHVTNGMGKLWKGLVERAPKKLAVITQMQLVTDNSFAPDGLHLAVGVTKNADRIEWLVEKAVELGMTRFTPLVTKRTERKSMRVDRLQNIALAAMKQSQRLYLPTVDPLTRFEDFVKALPGYPCYIAHCDRPATSTMFDIFCPAPCLICIGPEGDFTNDEVDAFVEEGGEVLSLGDVRLRTETAALLAASFKHLNSADPYA